MITEKYLQVTCSVTAARGRGKSAALGLAVAGSLAFGYTNIFVTSPSPDNLKTLFEFVVKGLEVMNYEEHTDFELIQSTNQEYNKALVRINVFKEYRQIIQVFKISLILDLQRGLTLNVISGNIKSSASCFPSCLLLALPRDKSVSKAL